jgi:hypothetical protein
MQMDRERRAQVRRGSSLMMLDEVPKFVLERCSEEKSGALSEEEGGLDDIMDPRQRRRLTRGAALAKSEVILRPLH